MLNQLWFSSRSNGRVEVVESKEEVGFMRRLISRETQIFEDVWDILVIMQKVQKPEKSDQLSDGCSGARIC